MSYKLYNRIGSGGFVVEAALALADIPHELVTLNSVTSTPLPASFRDINPWGQVPTLLTPDGDTLTESAAILIHLAACHPGKGLGPPPGSPEHGQFLRWLVFMSSNIYEAVLRATYPDRFTSNREASASVVAASLRRMGKALALIERELRPDPFLLGATMGAADLYLAMMFAWYEGELTLPRIVALTHAVAENAVVAPIWNRHFEHTIIKQFGSR